MNLDTLQWTAAVLGAFLVGLSKTGVTGLGMACVVLFATVFPSARQASGLVLPLLMVGDLYAVLAYRRHAQWSALWRLFPWTAGGVAVGALALGRMTDAQAKWGVGAMVCGLVAFQLWQRRSEQAKEAAVRAAWPFAAVMGLLAGFTTLVANAAGPLMALYLLAMRLPKYEFVGTGAVFFLLLNWFKVPFMVHLGLITGESLRFNAVLVPAVLVGALAGRWVLTRLNQRVFEQLAIGFSALAGLNLVGLGAGWWTW
jgi:uncharacterized protein